MTVAPSGYESTVRKIGSNVGRFLAALWSRYTSREIDLDEFLDLATILVTVGNQQAASVARLSLAAFVAETTGRPFQPATTEPAAYMVDDERIRRGLAKITTGRPAATVSRLERLATNEPLQTATNVFESAMHDVPGVKRWVRGMDANPCQLCRWWWRNGQSWPLSHSMPRHKGCACVPLPVIQ